MQRYRKTLLSLTITTVLATAAVDRLLADDESLTGTFSSVTISRDADSDTPPS